MVCRKLATPRMLIACATVMSGAPGHQQKFSFLAADVALWWKDDTAFALDSSVTRAEYAPWMRHVLVAAASLALLALLALVPAAARTSTQPMPSASVGAFYFDGWAGSLSNFHFAGLLKGEFSGRRPLSGWRDNTPEALQAQLRWA